MYEQTANAESRMSAGADVRMTFTFSLAAFTAGCLIGPVCITPRTRVWLDVQPLLRSRAPGRKSFHSAAGYTYGRKWTHPLGPVVTQSGGLRHGWIIRYLTHG